MKFYPARFIGILAFIFCLQFTPALLQAATETCLGCHSYVTSLDEFNASVHGKNGCISCHVTISDLDAHMAGEQMPEPVDCARCHSQQADEFITSVHNFDHKNINTSCTNCHTNIHTLAEQENEYATVNTICANCHTSSARDYNKSVHGSAFAEGNEDSATCIDCHGVHAISPLKNLSAHELAAFKTESCIDCHQDEEKMAANDVRANAVYTYIHNYHGKGFDLGFPEDGATCADCHTAHLVLPESDSDSSIHSDNLVQTCAQCHSNASPLFASFYAHADYKDKENYPLLYWTFMAMTTLLAVTFFVFWIHTFLWMFRGFIENREKQAAMVRGEIHHVKDAHKQYLRFEKKHIYLHLFVIISFLGLSLTGLPLKFSDQEWAKTMMSFFGGVHYAGLIHRGCAILTFYYFVSTLLMCVDFLFVRKDLPDRFLHRLFGPDSLMPNLRDIRDVKGMVRWFFFKGQKPSFERWTYWEKFDFIAVFWGMFAIGGSGLMLWFPEFFGTFLPGWAMNVATIVHSDEALLATGFIFTVHFFNTHGRPEKFPMDFVIFNGQISKEELIEERADQWKRYEEAGVTEKFAAHKTSGPLYDFFFKGFGFLALFTGLTLAFLMLYAFISG